jgi:uncharacterized iron-regulated protein
VNNCRPDRLIPRRRLRLVPSIGLALALALVGCSMPTPLLQIDGWPQGFAPDTIIDVTAGGSVPFDALIGRLAEVRVVYVGERHTSTDHHAFQLKVLRSLADRDPNLMVGMEMFDRTYQPVLDQWSRGELTESAFLRATHWYANWRFPYRYYRELLDFVRERGLPLIGLNVPFHLPAKIAVGGLDTLRPGERRQLPAQMDLTDARHREYVRKVYDMHRIPGREDFEAFYAAQCAWEDGMAETIAQRLGTGRMVVLVGNGHIVHKSSRPHLALETAEVAGHAALFEADGLAALGAGSTQQAVCAGRAGCVAVGTAGSAFPARGRWHPEWTAPGRLSETPDIRRRCP